MIKNHLLITSMTLLYKYFMPSVLLDASIISSWTSNVKICVRSTSTLVEMLVKLDLQKHGLFVTIVIRDLQDEECPEYLSTSNHDFSF